MMNFIISYKSKACKNHQYPYRESEPSSSSGFRDRVKLARCRCILQILNTNTHETDQKQTEYADAVKMTCKRKADVSRNKRNQ